MQSPTTTARRLSRTPIVALVASIFAALMLGLLGASPAHADTGEDGDTWPTYIIGITDNWCAEGQPGKVTYSMRRDDGGVQPVDKFSYKLDGVDGTFYLKADPLLGALMVNSSGDLAVLDIPSSGSLTYKVYYEGIDRWVGSYTYSGPYEDCGTPDPDPKPEPAPKPAKPTVQVLSGAPYKTSKVSRTCRIFNKPDPTHKAYTYAWRVTTTNGRIVAQGTKSIADGKYGDVQLKLGVGNYICWAQAADGKAGKSFSVRYAPSTFSVVNKSKGKVRVCHYSSSFKTGWQKPKKGGGWKSSKHWSKTKAQGSCTTRNTPDVGYGKSKRVLMTIGKPGADIKRVVVITNRRAHS